MLLEGPGLGCSLGLSQHCNGYHCNGVLLFFTYVKTFKNPIEKKRGKPSKNLQSSFRSTFFCPPLSQRPVLPISITRFHLRPCDPEHEYARPGSKKEGRPGRLTGLKCRSFWPRFKTRRRGKSGKPKVTNRDFFFHNESRKRKILALRDGAWQSEV
jgi:hypothetical protein